MPGKGKSSKFMQRCVADVTAQGKAVDSAFAICTAQSQRSGYTEPGTRQKTKKGKSREQFFSRQKDMPQKYAAYEKALGKEEQLMTAAVEQDFSQYSLAQLFEMIEIKKH